VQAAGLRPDQLIAAHNGIRGVRPYTPPVSVIASPLKKGHTTTIMELS